MTNAIYPRYKEALLSGQGNISLTGNTVKVALVDTGTYTYSAAHLWYSNLSGVVANTAALGTKTVSTSGIFDAANAVFENVSGAQSEAVVIWIDTGVAGTSRLVAYLDQNVNGLPVTPNGGNINLSWATTGIFQL